MVRRLYYCDQYDLALLAGHKFPSQKYGRLRASLAADGFYRFAEAPLAAAAAICRVHDAGYVLGFLDGTLPPAVI
ncbi:MAG: histone deacetylase, partial [Bryobacteraceae bacterium]